MNGLDPGMPGATSTRGATRLPMSGERAERARLLFLLLRRAAAAAGAALHRGGDLVELVVTPEDEGREDLGGGPARVEVLGLRVRRGLGVALGALRGPLSARCPGPRIPGTIRPMADVARALVSEMEFLSLPETTRPAELVDGEVIMPPSPSFWHQEVLARLVTALRGWAASAPGPVTIVQAPMDVRFGPGRILQPDAMVFLAALDREVASPIDRCPSVCIEVLSTNRAYDRVTKRFLYAEAGVEEYWLVDPAGLVERRSGPALARSEEVTATLRSALLPGFELDVPSLFR